MSTHSQAPISCPQAESWFPEAESELLELLQRWTVAFSRSLQTHLREDGDIEAELQVSG